MRVNEKIMLDRSGLEQYGPINIVIFGDSVSHGAVNGYIDYENVYWNLLKKKLNLYRDYVPVNMINASIGGTNAKVSLSRMEKQVFSHSPDLVIICFGLNDVNGTLEDYLGSLKKIFERCLEIKCDAIFMTPNMLNTYVDENIDDALKKYAYITKEAQCSGKMDSFIQSAISVAEKMNVTVCDCYSIWKKMSQTTDTTALLANKINHPCRELHNLFADELYKIICKK